MTLRSADDPVHAGACLAFASLHDGMLYCEQQYLQVCQHRAQYRCIRNLPCGVLLDLSSPFALQVAARHGLCQLNPKSMSLAEILRSHMEEPASLFTER